MALLLSALFILAPLCNANAQATEDEFGIWATVEASKKINKKFKVVGDVEFRTYDFVNNIERAAIGVKLEYKILKWLKSNVGYQFHYKHNPEETSIKDPVYDEEGNFAGNEYNIDNDYWVIRNRVYATISGEYKVGRFEFGLRERLQYTHTPVQQPPTRQSTDTTLAWTRCCQPRTMNGWQQQSRNSRMQSTTSPCVHVSM